MEIVHIVRQYRPSVGGLEDAVYNLCAHLQKQDGITVRIITLNRLFSKPNRILPAHEILDGISVTRLPYVGSSRYPIALSVLKEIRSATIVHVHAIDFFFDYLALTCFWHRKPLVASTHGGFFHTSFASRLKKIYFHTITRCAAMAYAALCTSSENDALTFSRIAPGKIVTIENGVNIAKWHNRGSASLQRTMIFIGRWSGNKAVPVLIDLIAALKQQGADWALIIAGIAGHETAASLQAHAISRGVESRIRIREGLSDSGIGDLIGQASYIASASRYEGFGISAVEGLSAGLIPLLSPIPPFEKLRKGLGLGAVIDAGDLAHSARVIEKTHADLMKSGGQAARERCMRFSEQYDWAGVTRKFIDVYRKVARNV